jgi:nickel-type superoxide dismutase maturation protease
MFPTLQDGQIVLADPRAYRRRHPQVGDIVLARHPFRSDVPLLLKRITAISADGRFHLRGDNPDALATTDSRSFGPLPRAALRGRVTAVWR